MQQFIAHYTASEKRNILGALARGLPLDSVAAFVQKRADSLARCVRRCS